VLALTLSTVACLVEVSGAFASLCTFVRGMDEMVRAWGGMKSER
jgi:hypothetical protein